MKKSRYLYKSIAFVLGICLILVGCVFNIKTYAGYDKTAPIVNSITIDKTEITKPGIIKLTFDITEEETGLSMLDVRFMSSDLTVVDYSIPANGINNFEINPAKYTGKFSVTYNIPSNYLANDIQVGVVNVSDNAGNKRMYWNSFEVLKDDKGYYLNDFDDNTKKCYLLNEPVLVKDEFDVDFQYHASNPNTAKKLSEMAEGKTGMITYDDKSHVAKKEWFDAIKGKNKSIVFSNNAIQWRFNGKDITGATKNIDLKADLSKVSGATYGNDNDVLKIDFADNGQLPGKTTMRIKSDYIYELFRLRGTAYLYYVNGTNASLESTNLKTIVDGTDHWCEFPITHNSTYVVSSQKVKMHNEKSVKTVTVNTATVSKKTIDKAIKKAGGSEKYVAKIILGKKVSCIKAKTFSKYKKLTVIEVKTKKLKKTTVKKSLKGSKVKKIKVNVGSKKLNKVYIKKYKKIFTKKNSGRKVSVK